MTSRRAVMFYICLGLLALQSRVALAQVTTLRTTSETSTVVEGDTATFTCQSSATTGATAPTVSWRKDNVYLDTTSDARYTVSSPSTGARRTSTFTIRSVRASDRGWYSCMGQTLSEDEAVDYFLNVQEPPRILSTQVTSLEVLAGTTIVLPCIVTAYPAPTITWFKDGAQLASGGDISLDAGLGWLTVRNVATSAGGNYSCLALSRLVRTILDMHTVEVSVVGLSAGGDSYPTNFNVSVAQATVGNTVSFTASIMARAARVVYSWERNGNVEKSETRATTSGTRLDIAFDKTVRSASDAGIYTITVDGNTTAVVGAIDVIPTPQVTSITRTSLAVVARAISRVAYFGCVYNGRPVATLWLTRVGTPPKRMNSTDGLVMDSKAVSYSDAPVLVSCGTSVTSVTILLDQINACSAGSSSNHITNPTGAMSASISWNTTHPFGNGVDSQTGNGYFTTIASPGQTSGALSRYMRITIGLAIVSFSFRMRIEPTPGALGSEAMARMEFLQRGPAEVPVTDPQLSTRVFKTNSSEWAWYHQNITAPTGSLVRGVRLYLSTQLAANSTSLAYGNFDTFCFRFFVQSAAAPVFVAVLQSEYIVYIGYSIIFDCVAEGKPNPTYRWSRNSVTITGATGATYMFTPSAKSQAGTYGCTAQVATDMALIGTIQQSTRLRVEDVVRPTVVVDLDNNGTVGVKSRAVNLTCPIAGAPLSFTWLKGTTLVVAQPGRIEWTESSAILMLLSAEVADAGQYECRANNTAGTSRAYVQLSIFTAPELRAGKLLINQAQLSRGAKAVLICPLVGEPAPRITWLVNGLDADVLNSIDAIPVPATGSLEFTFVPGFPDPITITCSGNNTYGTGGPVTFVLGSMITVPTTPGPTVTEGPVLRWWEVLGPFNLLARWIWILILVGVLLIIITIIVCCCSYCKKRRNKRSLTPPSDALRRSRHTTDTIRTHATYHAGTEGVTFVAINPATSGLSPEPPVPPMHSHPTTSRYTNTTPSNRPANGDAPPSYHQAVTSDGPPPMPNMESHPVMVREAAASMSRHPSRQSAVPAAGGSPEGGEDYLLPEERPEDEMAQRPPAPIPSAVPGAPVESPLQPLMQEYMNVDSRPPAAIPGAETYENFNP